MKTKTSRSWVNRYSVGLFTILITAGIEVMFGKPAVADSQPIPSKGVIGWYETSDGSRLLLSPSAHGGIYVADFIHDASNIIEEDENGGLHWTTLKNKKSRRVEFKRGDDGVVSTISWTEADGHNESVRRLADGEEYRVEEVAFRNGDIQLSGTLYEPYGAGPHPAAVIIHGSGASNRDNRWYQENADRMVRDGFAVLLPDKRGTGKSKGDWTVASFEDFAQDTLAGLAYLQTRGEIDASRIGLFGISQGGWIAPLTADLCKDVAFVIDISGSTVTPNEQIQHELGSGPVGKFRVSLAKKQRPIWWDQNGPFDPIPYWKKLEVPGLIIYGADDEEDNVPVKKCVELVESKAGNNPRLTVKVFEETGHGMYDKHTGRIREDYLDLLDTWLAAAVKK
jgi:dipeptidyl aminopeptidase/acylaminoacyl peptidase